MNSIIQLGTISGRVYGKVTKELIICVHGYTSSSDHSTIISFAKHLSQLKYGVFTFTFPINVSTNIRKQVMYTRDILQYFRHQYPDVHITLVGASLGALVSAIVGSRNNNMSRLITLNGYFGSYHLHKAAWKVHVVLKIQALWNNNLRKDVWNYIKNNLRPENIHIPTLVIHALHDDVVYPSQSVSFYKKLSGNKQLYLYSSRTANHDLTNKNDIRTIVRVIDKFCTIDYKYDRKE